MKNERKDPNVLHPGDQLEIPDRELKQYERSTDQRHKFVLHRSPLKLTLKLETKYGEDLKSTPCRLRLGADSTDLTTSDTGRIRGDIGKSVTEGSLTVRQKLTVHGAPIALEWELALLIGHVDPVEKRSGQEARLTNLAYYFPSGTTLSTTMDADFASAVEEFQCEHELTVTGQCDGATQAKLKSVHGS